MAEDLTDHLMRMTSKQRYMHSDIDTVERVEIISRSQVRQIRCSCRNSTLPDIPEVSLAITLMQIKKVF